jgi:hypothetical protein
MFAAVLSEIGSRLLSSERLLFSMEAVEKGMPESAAFFKGFCFIQMYAIYEYTVRASVQATLSSLKRASLTMEKIRREVLCLVLDPSWCAAADAGPSRVWGCRIDLLNEAHSDHPVTNINDTLFPADGSHYRVRQLHTIWRVLGIKEPIVPEPRLLGRIEEIVENRNAIAHGRRTAEDVGRSYSRSDIKRRFDDLKLICQHVLGTLEAHYNAGGLLIHKAGV